MTTQLDASIGIKKETTYGTAVVVDRHFEFLTESLDYNMNMVQGAGLRVGARVPRATRRSVGQISAAGPIGFEAHSRGMGLLFQAALGSSTSTVIAATTAYQQVHVPGGADPLPSYTIQKGVPPVGGGATVAETFVGCLCNTLELTCDVGGILNLNTEWMAKDMLTATAYAAPTYPAAANGQIFTFKDGAIMLGVGAITPPTTTALATGGTVAANVTKASVKWNNNLDTAGFYIGGGGKRGRPNVVQYAEDTISGALSVEYTDNVLRDAYMGQTDLGLLLTFQGQVAIAAANYPTIQVYVPNIRLNGEVPKANAGQVISLNVPYLGLDNTVATSPIYISYVTADTTI